MRLYNYTSYQHNPEYPLIQILANSIKEADEAYEAFTGFNPVKVPVATTLGW